MVSLNSLPATGEPFPPRDTTTMAVPFWRTEPITESEELLWTEVIRAHGDSAMRHNCSSAALLTCATGSSSYLQSLVGALMSLGGAHAPIERTMLLFQSHDPVATAEARLGKGWLVPGFGNSFEKGHKDTKWLGVDAILEERFDEHYQLLERITVLLHSHGKHVFPNPSAYTAITAIILQLPITLAPYLFISGRLGAWTLMFGNVTGALRR